MGRCSPRSLLCSRPPHGRSPPARPAQVPEAEARAYAGESGLLYFETSAKNNINVTNVFEDIADK